MLNNIDNLVFDLGGVVIDIERDRCVRALESLGIKESDELLDPYKQKGLFLDVEEGRITAAEFYDKMRSLCPDKNITDKQLETAFTEFIIGLPQARLKALRELRKTKKVYALSNTNPVMFHSVIDKLFRQEGLTIRDYFDGIITSFEEGVCKPSHRIFDTLLQRYDLARSRTLFFDDSQANCDAAEECGINAVLVSQGVEFMDVIASLKK